MCAKLALEHNLPSSFIAQATLQAELLECSSKSSTSYQPGFDYTARDMIPTRYYHPSHLTTVVLPVTVTVIIQVVVRIVRIAVRVVVTIQVGRG
jgi:hypothetical protein